MHHESPCTKEIKKACKCMLQCLKGCFKCLKWLSDLYNVWFWCKPSSSQASCEFFPVFRQKEKIDHFRIEATLISRTSDSDCRKVQFNLIHSQIMPFCGLQTQICFSTLLKTAVNLEKSFQYLPFWSFPVCWIFLNYADLFWLKVERECTESECEYYWISTYDCQSWNATPKAQHRTCAKMWKAW